MQAKIVGKDERGVGVRVIDNNSVKHTISLGFERDIQGHSQDGYPDDPVDRQPIETGHIKEVRNYARYHVARERDYETLPPRTNPANIAAVALVLADLDRPSLIEYFGDLSQQVGFHRTGAESVVLLPDGLRPDRATYYQDIYLDLDEHSRSSLYSITDQQSLQGILKTLRDSLATDTELPGGLDEAAISETPLANRSTATLIEAVSGIHICWADNTEQYRVERNGDPDLARDPDARLELMPFVPESIEKFHLRLVKNLFCQARDRYIGMGVTPPEPFQIPGFGVYKHTTWYQNQGVYQRYHDPKANIDWEVEPPEHRDE